MDEKLIGKKIGEGGMAFVHEYNSDFAIKTPKEGKLKYLLDEIELMKVAESLKVSPAVVEYGPDYYIMERYRSDLYDFINSNKSLLEFDDLLKLSADIARKIHILHSRNILHRDIKPQNILINNSKDVVLSDFGIALVGGNARETKIGYIKGSILDEKNLMFGRATVVKNNSYHADLYAFGMTMLFIFNKKADKKIRGIYEKCTEYKLENRFSSLEEVAEALENYE